MVGGAFRAGASTPAKHIILCIGDGMGPEQIRAAGMYTGQPLIFEWFPYFSPRMATRSANAAITDSAAAATAFATGRKVNTGVISLAIPGDGSELETLLEYYQAKGKRTGLVATSAITHATPAAFGAHEISRANYAAIGADYFQQTRPHVLMGGNYYTSIAQATNAGYVAVSDRNQLMAVPTETTDRLAGLFGSVHLPYEYDGMGNLPHLSEMTQTALNILDNGTNGFFMVLEGSRIDHACHSQDIRRSIFETIEFANAVQTVLMWAGSHDDVLIVVTADHETGGLSILQDNGVRQFPTVGWSTTYHSSTPVHVYAWGSGADHFGSITDNTQIYTAIRRATTRDPLALRIRRTSASRVSTFWQVLAGQQYQLEHCTNSALTNWMPAIPPVTAGGDRMELIHDAVAPVGFYRLRQMHPAP